MQPYLTPREVARLDRQGAFGTLPAPPHLQQRRHDPVHAAVHAEVHADVDADADAAAAAHLPQTRRPAARRRTLRHGGCSPAKPGGRKKCADLPAVVLQEHLGGREQRPPDEGTGPLLRDAVRCDGQGSCRRRVRRVGRLRAWAWPPRPATTGTSATLPASRLLLKPVVTLLAFHTLAWVCRTGDAEGGCKRSSV
eukprot:350184-Chlamydomonas_euryale.AAC.2